ncbi:MAG: endospore germination permease [Defluviitaleaceae bacterium]|nr:endospore germination permease [Defluviitaleaceae bacterium]
MLSANERITSRQFAFLIILSAMGTGLIILPRRVYDFAGHDGWLIALGLTVAALGLGSLIIAAARVKPGATFIGYASYALSRPVAYVCAVLLWAKLSFVAALELRSFLVITRQVLLNYTPMWVVGAVLLCVCAYAAVKGIETRARVAEILILLLTLALVFFFVIAAMNTDFSNLQPVMAAQPRQIGLGMLRLGFIFTGLECLLLASPYLAQEKKPARAVVCALAVAGVIITAITALTLAKFGQTVADEPWPVLRLMDIIPLPGSFIERQEAMMFSFWIVTVFSLVSALIFFGGRLLGDIFVARGESPLRPGKKHTIMVLVTAVTVFLLTLFPWQSHDIEQRLDWVWYASGAFFLLILPLAVLLGAFFRRKIESRRRAKNAMSTRVAALLLLILFTAPLFALAGCGDHVEIEDRLYVIAMAVDKAEDDENRYSLSVLLAASTTDEDETEPEDRLMKAEGQTLTEAMFRIEDDARTALYFGQAKLLVLGGNLLEDADLVQPLIHALVQNPSIDRQIRILSTPSPAEGNFCADTIEDLQTQRHTKSCFILDLNTLHKHLQQNASALLPHYPDGATALKDHATALSLTNDHLSGYLWCLPDKNEQTLITAMHVDTPVPFRVATHRTRIHFESVANCDPLKLRAAIEVQAAGTLPEKPEGITADFAEYLIAQAIAEEIRTTAALLQAQSIDAYQWCDLLRKKEPALHKKYASQWEDVFKNMEIVPRVTVRVS